MRRVLLIILATLDVRPSYADSGSELEKARNAYQYGDYSLVVETLRLVLYPTPRFDSSNEVAEARRLLGLAYLFQKNEADAERELVALLTLRPDASLDPLVDPPVFVEFFDKLKSRMKEQLDALRQLEQEAARARATGMAELRQRIAQLERNLDESEAHVYVAAASERSRLVAFMPFGIGQFQNGQATKGVLFLASELALGAASVGMAVAATLKWPDGTFPRDERDTADALVSTQVVTGIAFFAVAIWGIVDANLHFVPRKQGPPRRVPRDSLKLGVGAGGLLREGAF